MHTLLGKNKKCPSFLENPYPVVLINADNTTAESWTEKGCKESLAGRASGRIRFALMMNNPVGINTRHKTTKQNEIADRVSRFKKETNSLIDFNQLKQEYPQLQCCQRFQPSQELNSVILQALLQNKSTDPVKLSQLVLNNPEQIIT